MCDPSALGLLMSCGRRLAVGIAHTQGFCSVRCFSRQLLVAGGPTEEGGLEQGVRVARLQGTVFPENTV